MLVSLVYEPRIWRQQRTIHVSNREMGEQTWTMGTRVFDAIYFLFLNTRQPNLTESCKSLHNWFGQMIWGFLHATVQLYSIEISINQFVGLFDRMGTDFRPCRRFGTMCKQQMDCVMWFKVRALQKTTHEVKHGKWARPLASVNHWLMPMCKQWIFMNECWWSTLPGRHQSSRPEHMRSSWPQVTTCASISFFGKPINHNILLEAEKLELIQMEDLMARPIYLWKKSTNQQQWKRAK